MSVSDAWEAHAHDWIAWARTSQHDGFWFGTWPALRELLPAPGGMAVDLGCGEGRAGRELLRLGHRVIGVDRSPTLARAASTGDPAFPVVRADAAAVPITDEVVALVVASMSLMDVDDLERTVCEIARVLHPDGVLCAAIVHPFSSAEDVATLGTDAWAVSEPYLEPRRYEVDMDRDGIQMTFVSMHWPLSAYVNALTRGGLSITELREFGEENIPWLLAFRAQKHARNTATAV
jgi:SAM-dependent methyltransferase